MKRWASRLRVLAACLLVSALAERVPARSAEMKIGYFESTASITLIGPIVKGDFARFKSTIQKVADRDGVVTHLYIYSPGGSVDEAISIGRLTAKLALTTVAPSFDPKTPQKRFCVYRDSKSDNDYVDHSWIYDQNTRQGDRRCNCASACFLIWAAGGERRGNYLGVHRTFFQPESFKKDSYEVARSRYVRVRKLVEDYLEEMNVPNLVVDTMFSIGSTKIEPLSLEFSRVMQGGPALEEYLRAHCPVVTKTRELQKASLDTLKKLNVAKARTDKAQATYDKAFLAAYRCEIQIRRKIFNTAWSKVR